MIPSWKIKREIQRFSQQLKAIPEALYEPFLRAAHDRTVRRGLKRIEGDVGVKDKIALLLVYQPSGVRQSTLETLRYLVDQGYAPLVVANHPLDAHDQVALKPHMWRAIERPNFGYDFGGYRDGLFSLAQWEITPEKLLILNDSIWFPTVTSEPLLAFAETVTSGLGGTILRERGEIRFLESYFFVVPQDTLTSEAWHAFWQDLRLTSNKYKVIRRGERGLSEALAAAGHALHPAFPYGDFLDRLKAQDDAFLLKTLEYIGHTRPEHADHVHRLKAQRATEGWRARVLSHIEMTVPQEQPYSTYPYAMVRLFNYPILKKSNDRVARLWRAAYLRAIESEALPPPSETVLAELRERVQKDVQ